MKLDFIGNYFYKSDFSLAENNTFLQHSYTLKTREFLSKLRFIMHKFNKDDPKLSVNTETENIIKSENIELLSDKENKSENFPSFLKNDFFLSEEQKKNFKENIFNNYLNIGKFSKKFEDNFIKTLSENFLGNKIENLSKDSKNSKLVNNFMTKNDLLKHFKDNKKNIIFELFFTYDTFENKEKSENLLLRFFVSEFFSKLGDCWLKYFNPNFSITNKSNKDFLNQFKAMNYIIYHINNDNYSKAYACYEYVHKDNKNINKVKDSLEILGKNQVFCDVLEYHIEGSQNILDGTKYEKI